jgi:hypothetical protein
LTIPSDPKAIEKLKALAERNIANGDWGNEITVPGFPGEVIPKSPAEREVERLGSTKLPKK